MELKFLPSLLGGGEPVAVHAHRRGADGPLCRLYHESLYPCATAEHEIKRTPVASPASFWYFVDHFHREQIKSV